MQLIHNGRDLITITIDFYTYIRTARGFLNDIYEMLEALNVIKHHLYYKLWKVWISPRFNTSALIFTSFFLPFYVSCIVIKGPILLSLLWIFQLFHCFSFCDAHAFTSFAFNDIGLPGSFHKCPANIFTFNTFWSEIIILKKVLS